MVNSNPETVSTDYDTSDKLYFEPLTLEDVLNIYEQEKPEGVIVQFGGQTPLNLADGLKATGVPIIGTQPESIEMAEDRKLFAAMLDKLGLRQTPNGIRDKRPKKPSQSRRRLVIRFWCGPRSSSADAPWSLFITKKICGVTCTSAIEVTPDRPVLVDRFLEDAIEVDVDCISDGETTRDRRNHGAHRRSGHPQRRQRMCGSDILSCRRKFSMKFPRQPKPWRAN